MQGIYIYIPETNHVSKVYIAAAVLYLKSVLHVRNVISHFKYVLCFYISTFRCSIWLLSAIP
jgi:hypothetical protein